MNSSTLIYINYLDKKLNTCNYLFYLDEKLTMIKIAIEFYILFNQAQKKEERIFQLTKYIIRVIAQIIKQKQVHYCYGNLFCFIFCSARFDFG